MQNYWQNSNEDQLPIPKSSGERKACEFLLVAAAVDYFWVGGVAAERGQAMRKATDRALKGTAGWAFVY